MLAISTSSPSRRQALRRAVDVECGVLSDAFEDVAALAATDLSPLGMWLATDLPLALGDSLVVSFKPPRWPAWGSPVVVLAEVVRVGMPRRRGDVGQAGMGVRFLDLDPEHAERMHGCLLGLPPTLPAVRARRAERCEEQLVLDDGSSFEFRAESALLTAGRSALTPLALHTAANVDAGSESRSIRSLRRCAPNPRRFRTRIPRGASRRTPRREQPLLAH